MRYMSAFCLFVLLSGLTAAAQVLPKSNGSCRVTASGLESCDFMSGVSTHSVDDEQSALFVTRYILAPGAPLNQPVEGTEALIVGMGNGELLNEKKSPQSRITVFDGLVMLMPKQEPYQLRNVGKESLTLLLIEIRN
jgi:mannose-6-phosphate isomerase-like protein (cupin superfamily)